MSQQSPHSPQEGATKIKAVQRHAHKLYSVLAELSERENDNLLVFRGSLGAAFSSLGISQGYYTQSFKILKHNGCIEQLQQGSRGIDTVLVLIGCPDDPGALELPTADEPIPKDLTNHPAFAKLTARVESLEKLVGGLDITKVLKNFEDRITAQEKRGARNGKKP